MIKADFNYWLNTVASSDKPDPEESYKAGYKQALDHYGIWKDGIQVIGCLETPVKEIIKKVDKEKF